MQEDREPEVWKPVPDYEGIYEVSSWGRVKSLDRYSKQNGVLRIFYGRLLSSKCYGSYVFVTLCKNDEKIRIAVHLIVLTVFWRAINGLEMGNHKDLDKLNNYYKNLEWITTRENTCHYFNNIKKSSKLIGVSFDKSNQRNKRWKSSIYINKKLINLGRYYTEEEAHQAYLNALEEYGLKNKYAG